MNIVHLSSIYLDIYVICRYIQKYVYHISFDFYNWQQVILSAINNTLEWFTCVLRGIDPNAGEDWRQEEKGTIEDEVVRWHHQLDGHEPEQAPGVGNGQESLVCCSPWACKESDMTERLNWSELIIPERSIKFCCSSEKWEKWALKHQHIHTKDVK